MTRGVRGRRSRQRCRRYAAVLGGVRVVLDEVVVVSEPEDTHSAKL